MIIYNGPATPRCYTVKQKCNNLSFTKHHPHPAWQQPSYVKFLVNSFAKSVVKQLTKKKSHILKRLDLWSTNTFLFLQIGISQPV